MSQALIFLLLGLTPVALSKSVNEFRCEVTTDTGVKILNQGDTVKFEDNCVAYNCKCDKKAARESICQTSWIGCRDGSSGTCYKDGSPARVRDTASGAHMQCTCKKKDSGSFGFVECRSETCTDSRTGDQKESGENVTTVHEGITYVCTCDGVKGYKNCRTEESIKNEGKCLDDASGTYVPSGSPAVTKNGDTVLHCTCSGTTSYKNCKKTTCLDVDGSEKNPGEKVTVKSAGGVSLLVCDCGKLDTYSNCMLKDDYDNPDKCRSSNGTYVEKGARYEASYNSVKYECTCTGAREATNCVLI